MESGFHTLAGAASIRAMMQRQTPVYDVIVVGAGPNGLAAAVTLARAGLSVHVREAEPVIGGGTRTESLTMPGFLHDICSAAHPMAAVSPAFLDMPLAEYGLTFLYSPLPAAHPLDGGEAVSLTSSLEAMQQNAGDDGASWIRLVAPFVALWDALREDLLAPLRVPRHPLLMAKFGLSALRPAAALARSRFRTPQMRALFAGLAAHAVLPLDALASAATGLVLGTVAHVAGWPVARGGSQAIADALAGWLRKLGGTIETGAPVDSLKELPAARAVVLDLAPLEVARIAQRQLPVKFLRRLAVYRYGPGAFKLDWALSEPIPWSAPACREATTVHVGGTLEEIARSEADAWDGQHSEKPFVLLTQPTIVDGSRAPPGMHTAWAYCHVPNGSAFDMTARIEAQIERFAPGFRDCILQRSVRSPIELERHNRNLVGGDVTGGSNTLFQTFFRPTTRWDPYRTPRRGLYLCSASTPPGGGVHGMCGFNAAQRVLADLEKKQRR